ncbi:MAG: cytochrome d ubiquinol oxidase subunit II [Rhodovibrio sp.]|nr:cytochrome d ubiquinol oxidase subunit II [Rhodovibrio sp.]
MIDPATIWAALIAVAVLAYILLDGFDLGVGILYPLVESEQDRDQMMNSVAPVWDGNETWLILGGGGLFAVFPLAYATILPALYAPLTAMLLALVFRGVAFEFRWRSRRHKHLWSAAFSGGSILAAFAQGVALGALVQGIDVAGRAYAGGWFDWLSLFSVMTGFALVVGDALLGATWVVLKTDGNLRRQAQRFAWGFGALTLAAIGSVSLWTPFLNDAYLARWFAWPNLILSGVMPLLVLGCAYGLIRGLRRGPDALPFLAANGLFVLCYLGIGISFYPYIVPHAVTIWNAAAPDSSLWFLLAGTAVLLPMILGYTAYVYWVFRGKIDPDEGYH